MPELSAAPSPASRLILRQPLKGIFLSLLPSLGVAALLTAGLLFLPTRTLLLVKPIVVTGLVISLIFGLARLYARLTRRIYVDDIHVGVASPYAAFLGFRRFEKTQVRKVVVTDHHIHLLSPKGASLAILPHASWTRGQLQDLTAAIPCRSKGVWLVP